MSRKTKCDTKPKRVTMATVKALVKRLAKELPRETRQQILDLIWAGVPVKEIASQTGASEEQVFGVSELNIKTVKTLRKESL